MKIEATGSGKTTEDAIRAACEKLGKERDDVEIEILKLPAKRVLGFMGGSDAEVLAFYDDGKSEKSEAVEESAPKEKVKASKKAEAKEHKEAKKAEAKEEKEAKKAEAKEAKKAPEKKNDNLGGTKLERAENFLNKVLPYITSKPVEIKSKVTDEGVCINIEGEDINGIIGRRGETLDALQYLTGIVSAKSGEKHMRVYIDTGSYRARREQTLQRLANKYADRVRKTGRSLTLEAMSPNERRIIHMVIQQMDDLESYSKGEGSARRVVIALKR